MRWIDQDEQLSTVEELLLYVFIIYITFVGCSFDHRRRV